MNHTPHGTRQKQGMQSKQKHPVYDENQNHKRGETRDLNLIKGNRTQINVKQ